MRILVTNDDGISAAGLAALVGVAADTGANILVAAPTGERSGSGAALTVVETDGEPPARRVHYEAAPTAVAYSVRASPAMIAVLALAGEFGPPPDLVLSGINHGPNTGSAVLHSGTVGAAFTAAARGVPALAFSLVGETRRQWATAASVARRVLDWGRERAPTGVVINVNVPDVPLDGLRGIRRAHLATLGTTQAQLTTMSHSETVTISQPEPTADPGNDTALVAAGWATVTAVRAPCEVPANLSGLLGDDEPWTD